MTCPLAALVSFCLLVLEYDEICASLHGCLANLILLSHFMDDTLSDQTVPGMKHGIGYSGSRFLVAGFPSDEHELS
jgi:hypothetical protein